MVKELITKTEKNALTLSIFLHFSRVPFCNFQIQFLKICSVLIMICCILNIQNSFCVMNLEQEIFFCMLLRSIWESTTLLCMDCMIVSVFYVVILSGRE